MARWILWVLSGSVVVAAGACAYLGVQTLNSLSPYKREAARLDVEIAFARREGIPVTPEDLRSRDFVPNSQNGSIIYQGYAHELQKAYREGRLSQDLIKQVANGTSTEEQRAELSEQLEEEAELLEKMTRAVNAPLFLMHRDYSSPPAEEDIRFFAMKETANTFHALAQIDFANGNPRGGYQNLMLSANVANQLLRDPTLDAARIQLQISGSLLETLRQQLAANPNDLMVRTGTSQVIAATGGLPRLRHVFRSEPLRWSYRIASMDPAALQDEELTRTLFIAKMVGQEQAIRDSLKTRSWSFWRRAYAAMPKSAEESLSSTELQLRELDELLQNDPDYRFTLTKGLNGDFGDFVREVRSVASRMRLLDTTVAILDRRDLSRRLPTELAVFKPEPTDPLSDRPFYYTPTADGFRIASSNGDYVKKIQIELKGAARPMSGQRREARRAPARRRPAESNESRRQTLSDRTAARPTAPDSL
ncbi:MAG: hypothetical protein ACK4P3_08165 [Fimbriimonadaceae bacterium]